MIHESFCPDCEEPYTENPYENSEVTCLCDLLEGDDAG